MVPLQLSERNKIRLYYISMVCSFYAGKTLKLLQNAVSRTGSGGAPVGNCPHDDSGEQLRQACAEDHRYHARMVPSSHFAHGWGLFERVADIYTQFDGERDSFLAQPHEINFLAHNVTIPGASPQFPTLHCTADSDACLFTTGEGMSNAGNSVMALLASPDLDLKKTYFLVAGIAGGNPKVVPTSSVTSELHFVTSRGDAMPG
jgi:hypothetical protein